MRLMRLFLNILDLRLPDCAADVGEGEADDEDAATQLVGEVDSFGEFAADHGEEEGAAACGDCGGVFCEKGVCGCR